MEAPDGYVWPDSLAEVDFANIPRNDLDVALGGTLVLESIPVPEFVRAAWVGLGGSRRDELLYIDQALSGTGGRYIYIVTQSGVEWEWIGEMLCKSVSVSKHRHEGWNALTCVAQRALVYQRSLYVICDGRYVGVRQEVHDIERQVVQVKHTECRS